MTKPLFETAELIVTTVRKALPAQRVMFPEVEITDNVHCVELKGEAKHPQAQNVLTTSLQRIAAEAHAKDGVRYITAHGSTADHHFTALVLIERSSGCDVIEDVKAAILGPGLEQALSALQQHEIAAQ